MTLARWILLVTAVLFFLVVGIVLFPALQTVIRNVIPPNSTDTPIVAVGRALMPYIILAAVFYGGWRIWKTRGQ
jgi:hypothetical protein